MHIGTILIYLSLAASVVLFVIYWLSIILKKDHDKVAENLFYISGFLISLALAMLFTAFLKGRYDLKYVYDYSSDSLPFFYKLAAVWAGQEGTFLLWIFFLFIFGAIIIKRKDEYSNIVMSIIVLTQVFILVILSLRSPFEYIWSNGELSPVQIPSDGSGLNPLLQNPWMIIHPPVLFLGYASTSIPFGYAIAALIKKEYSAWIAKANNWVMFCMISLGLGIFLGAFWAYKVLGWGGYWGWDPVENSSLIPWLSVIALLHGFLIQKKRNALIKTNIFLAVISLVLVFYGTFLTRSGVLSDFSVHAFSGLGLKSYLVFYILIFLLAGISLLLFRYKEIKVASLPEQFFNLDNSLVYGIILLLIYMIFIFIGTSMPILSGLFFPNPAAVAENYYYNISVPVGILILVSIIIACIYRSPKQRNIKHILIVTAISVISGVAFNLSYTWNIYAFIFSILGFFIIIQSVMDFYYKRSVMGSRTAHLGIGLLVLGIIATNMQSFSIQKNLIKDTEADINGIRLTFTGISGPERSNLEFIYKNNNRTENIQTPYYYSEKTNSLMREPYIDYGFFRDIYIAPVEYKDRESAGKIMLSKGGEKIIDGIKIKFTGFDMEKTDMDSMKAKIFVKLNIKIDNYEYTVTPGLQIGSDSVRERIDALIPRLNRKISLLDFDITSKEILLNVEIGGDTSFRESVIVDVSFKRFVWLVWFGTALIMAGGVFAFRKRSMPSLKRV